MVGLGADYVFKCHKKGSIGRVKGCLKGVWKVSVRCLEGVCQLSGRCLGGVLTVNRRLLAFVQQALPNFEHTFTWNWSLTVVLTQLVIILFLFLVFLGYIFLIFEIFYRNMLIRALKLTSFYKNVTYCQTPAHLKPNLHQS